MSVIHMIIILIYSKIYCIGHIFRGIKILGIGGKRQYKIFRGYNY